MQKTTDKVGENIYNITTERRAHTSTGKELLKIKDIKSDSKIKKRHEQTIHKRDKNGLQIYEKMFKISHN